MQGVDTKILSKVLVNSLHRLVPGLVHVYQCGFVPGRGTHMNLRRLSHVMHMVDGSDLETALVALDIEKAFDTLGWAYLWEVQR